MKSILMLLFCLLTLAGYGQLNKPVSMAVTTSFILATDLPSADDAGIGFGTDVLFFSNKKLGLLNEATAEYFIGDKQLWIDAQTGEHSKSSVIYSVQAGPNYFITRNMALSATFGPAWHRFIAINFTANLGTKFQLTKFWGNKKHFITKAFFVNIPVASDKIQYVGLAAGYRF